LCTDGLTKHVSNDRIEEVLGLSLDSKAMVEKLVAEALDGGGTDNVSVIVARGTVNGDQ